MLLLKIYTHQDEGAVYITHYHPDKHILKTNLKNKTKNNPFSG